VEDTTVDGNSAKGSLIGEGGGICNSGSVLNLVSVRFQGTGATVRNKIKGNQASTAFDDLFSGP
jgi:hypothetical protein